jgi:hypothetical protein
MGLAALFEKVTDGGLRCSAKTELIVSEVVNCPGIIHI